MRSTSVFLLLTLFLVSIAPAQLVELTPTPTRQVPAEFKSDGCSGWPDGNYRECCVAHDIDYYFGGTAAERKASDKRLYKCVRDKGNKVNAMLMLMAVRVAAVQWLPTPFRWGFGRKARRAAAKQTATN